MMPASESVSPELKSRKSALTIVFLTVFIDLVGFGIIIPLSPYLARQFNADPLQIGLLMSIYSIMQFIFSPIWGRWSDRYGRRPVLLLCLMGSVVAHGMFAFATELWLLFLSRGLAGLFGGNISVTMAYMADVTAEKDRSKNMGLIGVAFGLGFVVGPSLGGLFAQVGESLGGGPPLGRSLAAIGASAICLLNFIFAFFVLKESLPPHLRMKTVQKESRWMLLSEFLQRPVVGHLMMIFFLSSLAMAHMESALFLLVNDRFGWGMSIASYGFAYVGVIMVFTQGFLIRRLLPVFGERVLLGWGLVLFSASLILIGFAQSIPVLAVAVTLLGVSNGCVSPSISGSLSLLGKRSEQGSVMGVNHSLSALGRILGPALGGWYYRDLGIGWPFWIGGGLILVAFLIFTRIASRVPNIALMNNKSDHV